jgi:hypothetical protein
MRCGECDGDIESPYHRIAHEMWQERLMKQHHQKKHYISMEIQLEGKKYKGLLYLVEETNEERDV